MIKKFLENKYGKYITNDIINSNNQVCISKINKTGKREQQEVIKILNSIKNIDSENIMPDKFWNTDIKWGVDFSSWIGEYKNNKDFFFIGAEPHINNNYQLVYDFGSTSNESINKTALKYYNNKNDIWHYISNSFVTELSEKNIISFLEKCYITDLCHIVPQGCGQVDKISTKLGVKTKDWNNFRTIVAKKYLIEEIKSVNPKFIILHGAASRDFFRKELNVKFEEKYQIADWNRFVLKGIINGYMVISIPHFKGQVLNELWRSKKHPERPVAIREILQKLINPTTNK